MRVTFVTVTERNVKQSDVVKILWWRGDTAMLCFSDGTHGTLLTRTAKAARWVESVHARLERIAK